MTNQRRGQRRASTIVEASLVLSMVLMFLFGIFEFGRYVFVLNVVENAVREGSRMGIAHTNDKVTSDVVARVTEKLAGVDKQIANLQITVGGVILRPQDSSEVAGTALTDWTDASTTDGISIQVTGSYKTILPTFLKLPATIPISARSVMYSEGN